MPSLSVKLTTTRSTVKNFRSNFKMAGRSSQSEGTYHGRQRVFVIHDGIDNEGQLEDLCIVDGETKYFKDKEDTRHQPLSAIMVKYRVKNDMMCTLLAEEEILTQWVQFRPTVTVIVLGQQDVIHLNLDRYGEVFVNRIKNDLKDWKEKAREITEDKDEHDYRMLWGHWFLLATPRYLMQDLEQMTVERYDRIRRTVEDKMTEKRDEFHEQRVLVFRAGWNIVRNIRKYVSKLLCQNCRTDYNKFTVRVGWFEYGGCDDAVGEEWIQGILEEEAD